MTSLEDLPPWLRPGFALTKCYHICFISTAACVLRATTKTGLQLFEEKSAAGEDFLTLKKPVSFIALGFALDDLPHDLSDLEMTWLP